MKKVNLTLRSGSWLFACLLLFLTQIAYSQTPTIVAIPTLGGDSSTPNSMNALGQVVGSAYTAGNAAEYAFLYSTNGMVDLNTVNSGGSAAYDINKSGQVTGYYMTPDGSAIHPFIYKNGAMTDLGVVEGNYAIPLKINDAGDVAGYFLNSSGFYRAFLSTQGQVSELSTLGGTYGKAAVDGLNASGWVAGESSLANEDIHACLWTKTGIVDLGTLGGSYSTAWGVNDSGWVAGYSYTANYEVHAFLYDGTKVVDIGTFGGGVSMPFAINNLGQVAGDSYTASGANHGFVYSDGKLVDIGTLGGDYSSVYDMNNSGLIVGESMTADGYIVPILWENGTMTPLADFLPQDSGWELLSAYKISDGGHIFGVGLLNGQQTWYLLSLNRTQNHPPVAVAGTSQVVECAGAQTVVTLDASRSSDPDGDALRYEWYYQNSLISTNAIASLGFGLGTYQIQLRVIDPSDASAQALTSVTVVDTTAPTVVAPAAVTLAANAQCQAVVPDFLANLVVSDICTSADKLTKTQTPAAGTPVGLGATLVQIKVSDQAGNVSSCATTVTVQDRTAPVIQSMTANPPTLYRSDNTMVPVTVTVAAVDNCDAAPVSQIVSVTSSEPVTGKSDKTSPDWQITGALTVNLRAELQNARVYTLTIRCTDAAGNATSTTLPITVEKSNSKSKPNKEK